MHPEKQRMGTDYVYVVPSDTTSYTYTQAADFCASNHNGDLPTIYSRLDARNLEFSQENFYNGVCVAVAKESFLYLTN